MRIRVKAKPAAKHTEVREENAGLIDGERYFVVSVTEPPREGRANRAIVDALAEYFKVPPSRVRIVSGFTSKEKIVEIL